MLNVKKVAVLGAGVMGVQIAAHFVNVGINTILFDLPYNEEDPNYLVKQCIKDLTKLNPPALAYLGLERKIIPANYKHDLHKLSECDLIIEAISERLEWKENLYKKISPYINDKAIVSSDTSSLSITKLSSFLPEKIQPRFCGIHFFNPPRYMKLIELVPHNNTNLKLLDRLESFITSKLGKNVIRVKDTSNFIGNRIGVFSILSVIHHADKYKLPIDVVDLLTGKLIGRPKSASFRTIDVVGLDTFSYIVATMQEVLKDDPWHKYFKVPSFIEELISKGCLGSKSKKGIYKKNDGEIQVFDVEKEDYRKATSYIDSEIKKILRIEDSYERFKQLKRGKTKEAKFLWAYYKDLFNYSAYHFNDIAYELCDIDLSLRWGYSWEQGPFELWQSANWHKLLKLMFKDKPDISFPDWVFSYGKEVHLANEKKLKVYKRQLYPDLSIWQQYDEGKTIFEDENLRFWTLDNQNAIASFKTDYNTITYNLNQSLQEAIDRAEKDFDALILWQRHGNNFSTGINLHEILECVRRNNLEKLEKTVRSYQTTSLRLRYSKIPTISATKGKAIGNACEFILHTDRTVAAFETYIGFIEVGIGILPIGAGTKEMAEKTSHFYHLNQNFDIYHQLEKHFQIIIKAEVSKSALDAKNKGLLKPKDIILPNENEILFEAIKQAKILKKNYTPPSFDKTLKVAGRNGILNFNKLLETLLKGSFISEHDFLIASKIAYILCGGNVTPYSEIKKDYLLNLELAAFLDLVQTKKTQERIKYAIKTEKFLKN